MKKIIAVFSLILFVIIIGGFANTSNNFNYQYYIYSNSNSPEDLLEMYQVKEQFLITYQNVVATLDEEHHQKALIDNLNNLSYYDNITSYFHNGSLHLVIKSGKGYCLSGNLQNNCNSGSVNKKFFIIDWIFGW